MTKVSASVVPASLASSSSDDGLGCPTNSSPPAPGAGTRSRMPMKSADPGVDALSMLPFALRHSKATAPLGDRDLSRPGIASERRLARLEGESTVAGTGILVAPNVLGLRRRHTAPCAAAKAHNPAVPCDGAKTRWAPAEGEPSMAASRVRNTPCPLSQMPTV